MQVEFRASERSTLGVEVELGIVDLDTAGLRPYASQALAGMGSSFTSGEHPRVKHEYLESTLEVVTGVCATVEDARRDLAGGVAESLDALQPYGMGLIASGLHPFSAWHEQVVSPGERYAEIVERIQWPVRRLMTQGVHYHVGVRSAERALAITTALTYYLPHFLALSASSPWWHGIDTGLASARSKVFEAMPSTGLPPQFDDWAEFESFMATLIRVGSITTIREVWWDVRPHPDFGTVELRMCDAMPTLRETCALAALAQSLVESFERRLDAGEPLPRPREWLVRENKWRATRYGLEAVLVVDETGASASVRDAVACLVGEVGAVAADLGCAEELADVLAMLDVRPSYARQRDVVAAGGTLTDVVHSLRRELLTDRPGA